MKKIDWQRLVPLGMNARTVLNWMAIAVGSGVGWSLQYPARLMSELSMLYDSGRYLIPGQMMPYFAKLLGSSLRLLPLTAAAMIPVAALFYAYHYQGSRSIYTMRRLPNAGELWRRVLTLPALTAAMCFVMHVLLFSLYYGLYLLVTPAQCLQPGQWNMIWEELLCWN